MAIHELQIHANSLYFVEIPAMYAAYGTLNHSKIPSMFLTLLFDSTWTHCEHIAVQLHWWTYIKV